MSETVTKYLLNVWALWIAKAPLCMWYHRFVSMVQLACAWTLQGWTDDEIIRNIRYTKADHDNLIASGDPADDFYTE